MAHTRTRHSRHSKHHHASVQHKPAPHHLGQSPTNSQKLIYIANKLGLQGIAGMQGSSFNIFDTVLLPTNANPQKLSFFLNANGKAPQLSNFQNGSLKAGEAMIIERLAFFLVLLTSNNLTLSSTSISDVIPLGSLADAFANIGVGGAQIQFPGSLKTGQVQINIANQTVVKNFNAFELVPDFNPLTSGISKTLLSTAALPATTGGVNGQNVIPTEAPPVLPPNLTLEIEYSIGAVGTVTAPSGLSGSAWGIMCVAGRFGSIFASKQTL